MKTAIELGKAGRRRGAVPRLAIIYLGVLLAAFLVGFLPMWLKARQVEKEITSVRVELGLARLELSLGTAAIDARRGEYEPARIEAVKFFQGLTDQLQQETLSVQQKAELDKLMKQRDMVITLLARSDPAAADRLANMHVAFRKVARN